MTKNHTKIRRSFMLIAILAIAFNSVLINYGKVSAAQFTSRKVTVSTSKSAQTAVTYTFDFTIPTATDVEGLIFEFCTSPLGTCTLPASMNISTATVGTQTGFPANATAFTKQTTSLGDCNIAGTSADTKVCVKRTSATTGSGAVSLAFGTITNPTITLASLSVYVRMSLYDNSNFSSSGGTGNALVHNGTVATAITQNLTISGRVQERMEFCVGALDDTATTPTSCSTMPTDTTVDLGIIDNSAIARSPVDGTTANGADDDYGVAMVSTNAGSGVAVTYYPQADSGGTNFTRSFRVSSATCNATAISTDQCFDDASSAGEVLVAGTEKFGMQAVCVDRASSTTGTTALTVTNAAYSGDADNSTCEDTDPSNKFAWSGSSTPTSIATSTSVIDDEMIKLRFGATSSAVTPTGSYSVVTEFIATPTF